MEEIRTKLSILYLLDEAKGPVSVSLLSEYILGKNGMDYFSFIKILHELYDDDFIGKESEKARTLYYLCPEGVNAMEYYRADVPLFEKEKAKKFLDEHSGEIADMRQVLCDHSKNRDGSYTLRLQLRKDRKLMADMYLRTDNMAKADIACRNWKERAGEIYGALLDELIR